MKKKLTDTVLYLVLCGLLILSVCVSAVSQENPSSAEELYTRGVELQNSSDWYGASALFREALQKNPTYGDVWFHLAQCAYQTESYDLALTYLDNAEKYTKNNTSILDLRGTVLISQGKLDDARSVFTKVLALYPNDVDARFGLAELDLFAGRLSGAEEQYIDALKRESTNRKALLSLALVSAEQGKKDVAMKYINQAIRYHSDEPEVHYLAAYIAAENGDWAEAERHVRAAVQIDGDYDKGYELLATILYAQNKFSDAIDVCDFRIGRNRMNSTAWYLKGLALYKLGKSSEAISVWSTGLSVAPQDEIMRSALELLVEQSLPVEDSKRAAWAQYHIKKAGEYEKTYNESAAHYEFQRALSIDPLNATARMAYADMLKRDGSDEMYLEQIKFMQKNSPPSDAQTAVRLKDAIEAYESLATESLAAKWNVKPLYLDKVRWKLGIYYIASPVHLLHADSGRIAAEMAAELFSGITTTAVVVQSAPVSGYGEAYRLARTGGCDYFMVLAFAENSREVAFDVVMYSAHTGTQTAVFPVFRTGNDRFATALQRLRREVLEMLPRWGKVIARDGTTLLIDMGRTEGLVKNAKMAVVRKGELLQADSGPGLSYSEKAVLGTLTVTTVGEEISEGSFVNNGYFDRLNVGDEVIVTELPKPAADTGTTASGGASQQAGTLTPVTLPAVDSNGKTTDSGKNGTEIPLSSELPGAQTSVLIDLIRNIH